MRHEEGLWELNTVVVKESNAAKWWNKIRSAIRSLFSTEMPSKTDLSLQRNIHEHVMVCSGRGHIHYFREDTKYGVFEVSGSKREPGSHPEKEPCRPHTPPLGMRHLKGKDVASRTEGVGREVFRAWDSDSWEEALEGRCSGCHERRSTCWLTGMWKPLVKDHGMAGSLIAKKAANLVLLVTQRHGNMGRNRTTRRSQLSASHFLAPF